MSRICLETPGETLKLQMLTMELAWQTCSKTEHRRKLQSRLINRSDGSIEFKHGNISAAMIDLGLPYVRGYKPRMNYQALLAIVADEQAHGKTTLDKVALAAVEQPAILPTVTDFHGYEGKDGEAAQAIADWILTRKLQDVGP